MARCLLFAARWSRFAQGRLHLERAAGHALLALDDRLPLPVPCAVVGGTRDRRFMLGVVVAEDGTGGNVDRERRLAVAVDGERATADAHLTLHDPLPLPLPPAPGCGTRGWALYPCVVLNSHW